MSDHVELPLRASLHEPLADTRSAAWKRGFLDWDRPYFPTLVGLQLEEVRQDYARLRLPFRSALEQPAGVVHGGAIATLIDTVVVPALSSAYDQMPMLLTIDLQIRFLAAARETDLVAEGWLTKRGKSISFCQAAVWATSTQEQVAEGWLVYRVISRDEVQGD